MYEIPITFKAFGCTGSDYSLMGEQRDIWNGMSSIGELESTFSRRISQVLAIRPDARSLKVSLRTRQGVPACDIMN